MVKTSRITQMGLYCEDEQSIAAFIARVDNFNKKNLGKIVRMNVLSVDEGDEVCPRPHVKLTLQFPSKEVQANFWTT